VTHGEVWLPFLLPVSVSCRLIIVLRAAVSAYLGRYRGETRVHTESDLRVFLRWCADHGLDPLTAVRVDVERYVRWLQDVRRYQPSTVSRRLSVVVGF
jgi:integrase/recombinase XerD